MPPTNLSRLIAPRLIRRGTATAAVCAVLATAVVMPAAGPATAASPVGTSIGPSVGSSVAAAAAYARTKQVFVLGDSLTVGAAGPLRTDLRNRVAGVTINAQVSRPASVGPRLLNDPRARNSSIWVVALGTNDGPNPAIIKSYVARVMRLAGPSRQVLWVNIVRPGGYGKVNVALKALESRYPNYRVLDWAGFIASHRNYLIGDGVHLTSQGYQARGAQIATATLALAMAGR